MDDGGPAFPTQRSSLRDADGKEVYILSGGVSLRAYAMIHAPAAEIADMVPADFTELAAVAGLTTEQYIGHVHYVHVLAVLRARWADAMIAELKKERAK